MPFLYFVFRILNLKNQFILYNEYIIIVEVLYMKTALPEIKLNIKTEQLFILLRAAGGLILSALISRRLLMMN